MRHMRHATSFIVKETGLSRSQVARLASKGRIPGAIRADGVHFEFIDSDELWEWISAKKEGRLKSPRFLEACDLGDLFLGKLRELAITGRRDEATALAQLMQKNLGSITDLQSSKRSRVS
jgi:hypothetical protein